MSAKRKHPNDPKRQARLKYAEWRRKEAEARAERQWKSRHGHIELSDIFREV